MTPPTPTADLSPTAEGHLVLLRHYLGFQGYVGVFALGLLAVERLFGPTVRITGNPWIVVPMVVVNTWAAFRTRRLLKEHDRTGALMAFALFGWNLIAAHSAGYFGVGALLSAIGIVFTANVFWQLRRIDPDGGRT